MPAGVPYRVVFSYSRIDSDFVLKTASALRRDGVNLWVDQLDIPKGARWDEAVEGAVKDCSCMLVVLSPDSVNSANVLDEVYYGLEAKKKVVPVVIRPCEIPFRLKRIQHIDFTAGEDSAYRELLAAVAGPQAEVQEALPIEAQGGGRFHFPGNVFSLKPAPPPANTAGRMDAGWHPPPRRHRIRDAMLGATVAAPCLLAGIWLATKWPSMPHAPQAAVDQPARTGPRSPPAPPAPRGADADAARMLDAQLRNFLADYIALHNRGKIADIMKLYDDKVAYNDVAVDKKFVLDDKTSYHRDWPNVVYRLAEEPTIKPSLDGQKADLAFNLDVTQKGLSGAAEGKVRQHLALRRSGDGWKITADRHRPLTPPPR